MLNVGYLENLESSISYISAKVNGPSLDNLLVPRSQLFDFERQSSSAKDILVCGISLHNFVDSQYNVLLDLVENGCRLRLLVIDPDVTYLDAIDHGMPNHHGKATIKQNIKSGLSRIGQLRHSVPDSSISLVQVKTYAGIPFFSCIKISNRGSTKSDTIWISHYSYGGATGDRRGFLVDSAAPTLFQYYSSSIEKLWAVADLIMP